MKIGSPACRRTLMLYREQYALTYFTQLILKYLRRLGIVILNMIEIRKLNL